MIPLIETEEDAARLREIARSWLGTPYAPDGAIKGSGVSCQLLPSAILQEFGFGGPPAPARGEILRVQILDRMRDWLDLHTRWFAAVDSPACGDVIVTAVPMGHLALMLDSQRLINCWGGRGVCMDILTGHITRHRLAGIWRPLK